MTRDWDNPRPPERAPRSIRKDFKAALAWLEQRGLLGRAEARRQLVAQAASDDERQKHLQAQTDYERRAIAAGRIA